MATKQQFGEEKFFTGEGGVTAVHGFEANGISCGIKNNGKKDLSVIFSKKACIAAGVFTTNHVKAAPLKVSKSALKNKIHAIICNSGNANACTGREGLGNAKRMVKLTAEHFDIPDNSVLVASTGIIGQQMQMQPVEYGIAKLRNKLKAENSINNAIDGIMTTDTRRKMAWVKTTIAGKTITLGGIAKGSGMICPNMATMLAFITTDANINDKMLHRALRTVTKKTFNKIDVDGQMSTNDCVFLLSNNAQSNPLISRPGTNYTVFEHALHTLCDYLAMEIVNDGEGISKVIKVIVKQASTKEQADRIARSIASSPLVKTAFFGQSANWGRIIQAVGACGIPVNPDKIDIFFNDVIVCEKGASKGIGVMEGKQLLNKRNNTVVVTLGMGQASDYVISTDLTYDYVKINSNYS